MKKNIIKWSIYLLFIALFNLLFFLLGGINHPSSTWISYVWIHVSYLFIIVTPYIYKKTRSVSIFNFTTYLISSIYFLLELIISLIIILTRLDDPKLTIVIQIIPFGVFLFIYLWNLFTNELTTNNEKKKAEEILFIKTASIKVKKIMEYTSDKKIKSKIETIYDLIHSSPIKSDSSIKDIEKNIMKLLCDLDSSIHNNDYISANEIINEIKQNIKKRNDEISLLN